MISHIEKQFTDQSYFYCIFHLKRFSIDHKTKTYATKIAYDYVLETNNSSLERKIEIQFSLWYFTVFQLQFCQREHGEYIPSNQFDYAIRSLGTCQKKLHGASIGLASILQESSVYLPAEKSSINLQ